jgi:hypothetical protein
MNSDFLTKVFELLNKNQELPYYQAERRIDIFVNLFLEDIVHQKTKFVDAKFITVEFPLKKMPEDYKDNNRKEDDNSAQIDYLMVDVIKRTVLLIELKTDDNSFDSKQIKFYLKHQTFEDWYDKFKRIKMINFKEKRDKLHQRIIEENMGKDFINFSVEVIVLKPTYNETKDRKGLEKDKERIHFVALKSLDIVSKDYPNEWKLFKENVLEKLPSK